MIAQGKMKTKTDTNFGGMSNRKCFNNILANMTGSVRGESDNNSSNSASLKGKIQTIEDTLQLTQDEMNSHKKDVNSIKTERDSLQEMLRLKIDDIKNSLMNDIGKLEDEFNKTFTVHQKGENQKLLMELNKLKNEKTELQKTLLCII